MDNHYLTNHELVVNSSTSSLATGVSVLLGTNRDETGIFVDDSNLPAPNQTFTSYLDHLATSMFGAPPNLSSTLGFDKYTPSNPLPGLPPSVFSPTATQQEIFNATIRLTSSWLFTCNALAKAYSASKHRAFAHTYVFEFNRTYSPSGYTTSWCDPPATPSRPHGDPDAEYFKCHAGEQLIVFGTARRAGQPDRDGLDVPFMQLVVDYWATFARWGDPNPRKEWLAARGYEGTLREVRRTGRWEEVDWKRPTMRLLQWGGKQGGLGWGHNEICGALGAGLDGLEVK
jgi:carboxylesterase type B